VSALATAAERIPGTTVETSCTVALLKPDAVRRRLVGSLLREIEIGSPTLYIGDMRKGVLEREEAEEFYAEHMSREYFAPLVDFMTSGPIVALTLTTLGGVGAVGAVGAWRDLMGHADPAKRLPNTIRGRWAGGFALENLVHGSDSTLSYLREYMQLKKWGLL
jgi:nucleoside-diphosphate kinase